MLIVSHARVCIPETPDWYLGRTQRVLLAAPVMQSVVAAAAARGRALVDRRHAVRWRKKKPVIPTQTTLWCTTVAVYVFITQWAANYTNSVTGRTRSQKKFLVENANTESVEFAKIDGIHNAINAKTLLYSIIGRAIHGRGTS